MAQEYVLRDTLTYTIEKLNHSIHDLQSRVIECESKIAQLNNQVYNIQYGKNIEFRDRMDELTADFKDLKCQIVGEVALSYARTWTHGSSSQMKNPIQKF